MRNRFKTLAVVITIALSAPVYAPVANAADAGVTAPAAMTAVAPTPHPAAPEAAKGSTVSESSAPAPAPVGELQQWWQALLVQVMQWAGAIFVPVLGVLVAWLLRKIGINVDIKKMELLAHKGWAYAEHKTSVLLKEGQPKAEGAKKLAWAFELIDEVDAKVGASDKARKKLTALIMAKIGEEEQKTQANGNGVAQKEDTSG